MTSAKLDPQVEKFIVACINSVEQLEILLLMRARHELDAETITQELRTSTTSVEKRLADLTHKKLLTSHERDGKRIFVYEPPQEMVETLNLLAAFYSTHRVAVINLIFAKPSDALTGFSDAFRFKE